jgi:hypothetical protein
MRMTAKRNIATCFHQTSQHNWQLTAGLAVGFDAGQGHAHPVAGTIRSHE